MLNSCCYWEDIHMFSISYMSNLFSRGLRRYLSHALWVFKIVSSLNLFKLISRSGGQWTFRMTLVTVGYICFSLMDKNVKPGAALGGGQRLRLFVFSTSRCGLRVTPVFWSAVHWVRTSHRLFVQHVFTASGCNVGQLTVIMIIILGHPQGTHQVRACRWPTDFSLSRLHVSASCNTSVTSHEDIQDQFGALIR